MRTGSHKTVILEYRKKFGLDHRHRHVPSKCAISKWVAKFRELGTVQDQRKNSGGSSTVRTAELVETVSESVRTSPKRSTRRRSQALGIARTTLMRILHKDLDMKAYHVTIHHKLSHYDKERRVEMAPEGHSGFLLTSGPMAASSSTNWWKTPLNHVFSWPGVAGTFFDRRDVT